MKIKFKIRTTFCEAYFIYLDNITQICQRGIYILKNLDYRNAKLTILGVRQS